jgi:hypothetical protein
LKACCLVCRSPRPVRDRACLILCSIPHGVWQCPRLSSNGSGGVSTRSCLRVAH